MSFFAVRNLVMLFFTIISAQAAERNELQGTAAKRAVSLLQQASGSFRLYNCLVDLKVVPNSEDCDATQCGIRINAYAEDIFTRQHSVASFIVTRKELSQDVPHSNNSIQFLFLRHYDFGKERWYENMQASFDRNAKMLSLSMTKGASGKNAVRGRVLCRRP